MKIKNVMKYPNARIIYDSRVWEITSMNFQTGILSLFYEKIYDVTEPKDYKRFFKDVEVLNCKLQLRTLESLTMEEINIIQARYIPLQLQNIMTDASWRTLKSLLQYCDKNLIVQFIDYLRLINIDIDGLIESGEADLWTK